ncbi:unnamed protein product [Allacma fusca]|uniref:Uncharacterized protein n=1 Tax=Allacma fusca TaxID=39272 RepID=A0A8J2P8E9_9HEXA|nr:unnamed protein product [Allacma fusca]
MEAFDTEEVIISLEERKARRQSGNCRRSAARKQRKNRNIAPELKLQNTDKKFEKQKQNLMARTELGTRRIFTKVATEHFHPRRQCKLLQTATTSRLANEKPSPSESSSTTSFTVHFAWSVHTFDIIQEASTIIEKDSVAYKDMMLIRTQEQSKRFEIKRTAKKNDFFARY